MLTLGTLGLVNFFDAVEVPTLRKKGHAVAIVRDTTGAEDLAGLDVETDAVVQHVVHCGADGSYGQSEEIATGQQVERVDLQVEVPPAPLHHRQIEVVHARVRFGHERAHLGVDPKSETEI